MGSIQNKDKTIKYNEHFMNNMLQWICLKKITGQNLPSTNFFQTTLKNISSGLKKCHFPLRKNLHNLTS